MVFCKRNHFFGNGIGGRLWFNPILGENELIPYRYCWSCGYAQKWLGNKWEPAPEWFHKFKGTMWAARIG